MSRKSSILIAIILTLPIGLHWAVIRTAAWSNMIITYAVGEGFIKAVDMTFSGQFPCKICKFIEADSDNSGNPNPVGNVFKTVKTPDWIASQTAPLTFESSPPAFRSQTRIPHSRDRGAPLVPPA